MSDAVTKPKSGHKVRGRVLSAKMDKTITVQVERKIRHPLYQKYVRRSTKLYAHDEANACAVGDEVLITPCRPLSRLKRWRLLEVTRKD